jgi:hypothetical protein
MSRLKTPREKKDTSLTKDCRNVYGENDKASRKLIPRGKQLSHQGARRTVREVLANSGEHRDEDDLVQIENSVRAREIASKRNKFRKRPDATIEMVLAAKHTGDRTKLFRDPK